MGERGRIRLAIVGSDRGFFESELLSRLLRSRGVEVVAVGGSDVARWRDIAPDIQKDWRLVVGRSDLDAVVIDGSLPHEEISIAALEAGRHVLVTQPMARSTCAARRMARAASERRQQVSVLAPTPRRVDVDHRMLEVLSSGSLGQITAVDLLSTTDISLRESGRGLQPGSLWEFAEILNCWVGPYRSISSVATSPIATEGGASPRELAQVIMIIGLLESGAAAVEYHSNVVADARTPRTLLTIHGVSGSLRCDFDSGSVYFAERGGSLTELEPGDRLEPVEDFLTAVRQARDGTEWARGSNCDFSEGLRFLNKVEGVARSAAERRFVDLG